MFGSLKPSVNLLLAQVKACCHGELYEHQPAGAVTVSGSLPSVREGRQIGHTVVIIRFCSVYLPSRGRGEIYFGSVLGWVGVVHIMAR